MGLNEYEVRTRVGWYRHVTLIGFALAYLTVARYDCTRNGHRRDGSGRQEGSSRDGAGENDGVMRAELEDLLPRTVAEVRRLLFALAWQPSSPVTTHVLQQNSVLATRSRGL